MGNGNSGTANPLDAKLVSLEVLVTDEDGGVLTGLKKENFRALDNGRPQEITQFAPPQDPITIVLLIEYSGIAYDYFAYKSAIWGATFLKEIGPKDYVALVTYDVKPAIQVDFTRNKYEVQQALEGLSFPGFRESNMFDALMDTVDRLQRNVKGKKAILLITTGMNTFSQTNLDDVLLKLKESDVTVFCVGVAESEYVAASPSLGGSSIGYIQARNQLQAFADLTGGYTWLPRFEAETREIVRSIAVILRSQYTLGFLPPDSSRDGKYHKIEVQIIGADGKPLVVTDKAGKKRKVEATTRAGYFAPDKSEGKP